MANARYITDGMVGAAIDARTAEAEFELGTVAHGNTNKTYIYVVAGDAVAAAGTCTVTGGTTVTNAAGNWNNAGPAFATGQYGWVEQAATS